MSQSANPLSASEPWNLVADGYAETTMPVFELFADEAIAACKLKPGAVVLDVACGPGRTRGWEWGRSDAVSRQVMRRRIELF